MCPSLVTPILTLVKEPGAGPVASKTSVRVMTSFTGLPHFLDRRAATMTLMRLALEQDISLLITPNPSTVMRLVARTSPEAPVPILGIERQSVMLGGVGNVARNLISIGAHAALLSVVGDDEVGRLLTQMVGEQERIEPHLLVEPGRPSTEKTRFVAGGQQLQLEIVNMSTTYGFASSTSKSKMTSHREIGGLSDSGPVLSEISELLVLDEARLVFQNIVPVVLHSKTRSFRHRNAPI